MTSGCQVRRLFGIMCSPWNVFFYFAVKPNTVVRSSTMPCLVLRDAIFDHIAQHWALNDVATACAQRRTSTLLHTTPIPETFRSVGGL